MRTAARSPVAVGALALASFLPGAEGTAAGAQSPAPTGYEARLAAYRSGEFVAALRASAALPMDRLRDEAEEFFHRFPGRSRQRDHALLAVAMLHLDLAGAAGMAPEKNESIARSFFTRVSDGRRDGWRRDAWIGLLGVYVDRGRLGDAARLGKFLGEEYGNDRAAVFARSRLAEFIGWGLHDERFLDQAQAGYEDLLPEALAGAEGPEPADLRLRIAHLTLRAGNPEAALAHLDEAGNGPSAVHRFVGLLLRGETMLWLGQALAAERAFADAQAIHFGSVSAAAGLVAARETLGDTQGAVAAVRGFLSESTGDDAWWNFLAGGLGDESRRLDRLRALTLQRD